jgi:hypothetical protein
MQIAGAQTMEASAMIAVAIADEYVTSRLLLQEESKIFPAHGGFNIRIHRLFTHNIA